MCGGKRYMGSLYLLFTFVVNLNSSKKIKSIKKVKVTSIVGECDILKTKNKTKKRSELKHKTLLI